MGTKNIYERFVWFDNQVRAKKCPNATTLANQFEISTKTAQRDIEFMRDRLLCPLLYDASEKEYCYDDETFSLPIVYLSSGELSSLLIARKMLKGIGGVSIGDEIPASEGWLFQNEEAFGRVKKGIRDAPEGKISKLNRKRV
jgi:hypothetical protein